MKQLYHTGVWSIEGTAEEDNYYKYGEKVIILERKITCHIVKDSPYHRTNCQGCVRTTKFPTKFHCIQYGDKWGIVYDAERKTS